MTHLLDTSAVLTHFMDEPGAEEVEALLSAGAEQVALAAPTWVELARRLDALMGDPEEAGRVFDLYTSVLCGFVPVDETSAGAAIRLQAASPQRLPLVGALIAGCAAGAGLTLVHRDTRLSCIPSGLLTTIELPAKA